MRFTVVKSSELGDRWDAQFHIALAEVRARYDHLRRTMTSEEAITKLNAIPNRDRMPLAVLFRGSRDRFDGAASDRVIREYPHLALAIMERNLEPAINRIRDESEKNEAALKALMDLARESGTQPSPRSV